MLVWHVGKLETLLYSLPLQALTGRRAGLEFEEWQVTIIPIRRLPAFAADDQNSLLKKCTPATPRCLRCTELGIDECLYVPVKKRGAGNTLRMGEACQRCR